MIEINNKHIVLILLVIIIGVFIYNYDVYVIPKNEPLCKPVYVTKRELTPEMRAELNKTESEILKETFNNLADIEYFESFGNLDNLSNTNTNINTTEYDVPPKSFGTFVIPSITTPYKIKVIDSVIKILSYIPTNYCESQIKQMVEYYAVIYETSPNLEIFYKNIASSTKINESPYNSKYSHLILFLIGKFDNDYFSSFSSQNSQNSNNDNKSEINLLLKNIFDINSISTNAQTNKSEQENKINYLSEQIAEQVTMAIDEENNFDPKQVLNIISKSKNKISENTPSNESQNSNIILPKNNNQTKSKNKTQTQSQSKFPNPIQYIENKSYLDEQYPSGSNVPNYIGLSNSNQKLPNFRIQSCSNTSSYLDSNSKPIENFGNIYDDYAIF